MIEHILLVVVALFPLSEIALAFLKRSHPRSSQSGDQGSMRLLWLSIALGVALGIVLESVGSARLPIPLSIVRYIALILLVGGLTLRWIAIVTLGKLFTVDVAVHSGHVVIEKGLYRFMRHPSYTGLLLAFVGLGVFFDNWLSIVALLVPIAFAVRNRVAKEEEALREFFGPAYLDYCARTKRFMPGLF